MILTTLKPHMVILSVIYLLGYMLVERKLIGWAGLAAAGLVFALILFVFRPAWITDLKSLIEIAPVHWATPTIGGLLSYWEVTEVFRYMIVLLLPLPFILLRYRAQVPMELTMAFLTVITVPTTFFLERVICDFLVCASFRRRVW